MLVVILIFLLAIFVSLGMALLALAKGDRQAMWYDLLWRMLLTVGLFAVLMLGWYLGWWQPHTAFIA